MRSTSSALLCVGLWLALLATAPRALAAQLLGLETVPLAAGDQFFIAPARNAGMAGPSIALADPLLDPFVNPAKGARLTEGVFFGSPTTYSVSNHNGRVRTLPLGMLLTSGDWFGGGVVAMQQVDMGGPWRGGGAFVDPLYTGTLPRSGALIDQSSTNKYFQATFGRRLGNRFSLGASAMAADLNGTDGVEDLFVNAWEINEFGHMEDYRIGLTGNFSGDRTFEAVILHNRFSLTQDVTSVSWTLTDTVYAKWTPLVQDEANLNQTRTWGAHVGYTQPVGVSGLRIGGALTANRKQHPKIPAFDLANVQVAQWAVIPRDPGESWAYSIGVGLSQQTGPTTFAMDVAYEPAVSDTWADTESDTTLASGTTLRIGDHLVDNRFVFSNARLAFGLTHEIGRSALQFGVRAHHVDYRLVQDDHAQGTHRTQTEQWTEWTPTWGFRFTWTTVELRYSGSASSASHFPLPSLGQSTLDVAYEGAFATADVLAPPTGRLVIPDETVVTHRLAVSIPIR